MDRPGELGPLFDCRARLLDPQVTDVAAVLARAGDAGVVGVVSVGRDLVDVPMVSAHGPSTQAQAPAPVTTNDGDAGLLLGWAHGLHPRAIDGFAVTAQLDCLPDLLARRDVVALGEIGLDGGRGAPPLGVQEVVLRTQLQLARHMNLPVLVSGRGASHRLAEILLDVGALPRGGVLAGFDGAPKWLKRLRRMGYLFSFGPDLSDPAANAQRLVARKLPLEGLLVESNAPYGGEPKDLPAVIRELARLRGESASALAQATTANARRLFARTGARG